MLKTREPTVAGTFYPADSAQLKQMLTHYPIDASTGGKVPKAIIAPHTGFIYSGPIAASVYARFQAAKEVINRVLLIGPSHRVRFQGLALSSAEQFSTPLGNIKVDTDAIKKISEYPFVNYLDKVHELEHSLDVHLPFLQTVLKQFSLVPIVAGDAPAEQVCQLLEQFWGKPGTLIVISSDLSHFHEYEIAQKLDSGSACGRVPITGLLLLARKKNLQVKTIDIRNSGHTAGSGDKNRVVGYGAYVVE